MVSQWGKAVVKNIAPERANPILVIYDADGEPAWHSGDALKHDADPVEPKSQEPGPREQLERDWQDYLDECFRKATKALKEFKEAAEQFAKTHNSD